MKEIERKVLNINVQEVEKKLLQFGAEKKYDGLLDIYYLDYEDGRIKKKNELLRVREYDDGKVEITHKTNHKQEEGNKIYDEYVFKGTDLHEALKFFKSLGFVISCHYQKRRKTFKMPNAEVVIDIYPKIPPLIEVEASGETDVDKLIDLLIEKLELKDHSTSTETISDLLKSTYPEYSLDDLIF